MRNSRREGLGGGGKCDGARQAGGDKGVGNEEGEECMRQTDDDTDEEPDEW